MKKILIMLASVFAVACSSNDDVSSDGGNPVLAPMSATIDSKTFSMEPESGGNLADPSGGMFGSEYYLLEGYKEYNGVSLTAKLPITNYQYYVRLAIPKIDVSVGLHSFTGAQLPNGYYADLDIISEEGSGEAEETINGSITVTSYDVASKRVVGTFEFKTNNGISATQTHVISGAFNYILPD